MVKLEVETLVKRFLQLVKVVKRFVLVKLKCEAAIEHRTPNQ